MATASLASHNSDESKSGKRSDFLSRSDIAELLDKADFSCESEAFVIRKQGREKGSRHYRRGHLVTALKGIWRAATSPYGSGEIHCFASVEGYAIEAVTSERAMRYKLRELERIGVIEMIYAANTIRRPATYRLNISKLRERCRPTYQDVKSSRPAPTPFRPHSEKTRADHRIASQSISSPPAQEPASHGMPPAAAPVAEPMHRGITRGEDRVRKIRRELMEKFDELKRGQDRIVGQDGLAVRIEPGHRDYRPPLPPDRAWIEALMLCQVSEKEAREKLGLSLGKFVEDAGDNSP